MTKATMPEPVAYAHRDILRRQDTVERIHPTPKYGTESVSLITTDQAEAYAAARVREALEDHTRLLVGAAAVLEIATESMEIGGRDECAAHEARSMAQTIRLALISDNEYQSDVQAAAGGLTQTPLEY